VTLIERPVRVNTLVAVVSSALRSRLRQYLVRDQLRALEEATDNLTRANRELEQFAYIASHDLQEPLRMVTSYMQLIQRKYADKLDEKAEVYIHHAVSGTRRMQSLIEGLLKYSRITRPEPGNVDTNGTFADAVANLAAAIRESDAEVTGNALPTVSGDSTQLLQLFQNLLSNGIKYRKPGTAPRVTVSAQQIDEAWLFSVRDNGIGIDRENHEKVFEIFRRLHTQEEYPGTGIGLASCKKIVEQHGGKIWLESSPGEGTTFFFTIPRKE
jgi:light-regulated signal transduction histidine kinase (bacteriophytochrome)